MIRRLELEKLSDDAKRYARVKVLPEFWAWVALQDERHDFDIDETIEAEIMSEAHFRAFRKFLDSVVKLRRWTKERL
jgi:hypothetical protein